MEHQSRLLSNHSKKTIDEPLDFLSLVIKYMNFKIIFFTHELFLFLTGKTQKQ